MNIKNSYLNLSIKYKLLIFFYIIILMISLAFGFYSYSISVKQVKERVSTSNYEVVKQISNNISFLQKDTIDISSFISVSNGIQPLLTNNYSNKEPLPKTQIQNLQSLQFILSAIVTKDYLSGMILYNKNGQPVYNEFKDGSSGINNLSALNPSGIYDKINKNNGKPLWFSINKENSMIFEYNASPKIAMGRVIRNVDTDNEKIGYILLFINKKTIEDIYKDNIHSKDESFFIIDESHNLISNAGTKISKNDMEAIYSNTIGSSLDKNYFTYNMHGKNMLITCSPITTSRWNIFYTIPMKNMIDQITSIKRFTLVIIILAMIFTFPFILLISTYFTAPIKKLLSSMKKFQKGNFNEKVFFKYSDEIGMLGNGYNKMVENIKELIDTTYKLQIKGKDAELRALQAQINPHFLYNTLNTIYWKAVKTDQTEISEMTLLLSQLFRLSLNMGKDWITLAEERELIFCYLSLQAIRFKERLAFNLLIDDNIMRYSIPKLILQPFVENALLHGIGDRAEGGAITVTGKLIDNKIHFSIEDNGLGMNSELVNSFNSSIFYSNENNSKRSSYAIKNVVERLKLTFNDKYSLTFNSTIGNGTIIKMIIPAVDIVNQV